MYISGERNLLGIVTKILRVYVMQLPLPCIQLQEVM